MVEIEIVTSALNEGKNLRFFIESILKQKGSSFTLKRITIISDGSTDNTEEIVKSFKDSRINLILHKERAGKQKRINEFMNGKDLYETIVHFDTDIILEKDVLQKLADIFAIDGKVGLACGKPIPLTPNPGTLTEKIALLGMNIYSAAEDDCKIDVPSFRCNGRVYAISNKLANLFQTPSSVIEDDRFLYYTARVNNFDIKYCKEANIYYRLPSEFKDYIYQLVRYCTPTIKPHFNESLTKKYDINLRIPVLVLIFKSFFKKPLITSGFFISLTLSFIISRLSKANNVWKVSPSTKSLFD